MYTNFTNASLIHPVAPGALAALPGGVARGAAAATPCSHIAIMLGPNVYISMLISIDYSQYGMNTCDSWFA